MSLRKVIIITGSVGAGKTTFLSNISTLLRRRWSVDGFLSLPVNRPSGMKNSASSYEIKFIKESGLYSWAKKNLSGEGYSFDLKTQSTVEKRLSDEALAKNEIIILDDLGFLETQNSGFSNLIRRALVSNDKALVLSVKKAAIDKFVDEFKIENYVLLDLDETPGRKSKKILMSELAKMDGEDIGIFSTINGVIEVGLGSFLHATRFPMKGYILVCLQNFFLVLFAKELKGRGLMWISLISAGMKSFSPAGGRLKPMIYIFLQGVCFSIPISILGWNFFSAFLGSLLIQFISLVFKFLSAYITFGSSVFDASLNMANTFLEYLHLGPLSLITLLVGMSLIKITFGIIIAFVAYYFDFSRFLFKWRNKVGNMSADENITIESYDWKSSIIGGLKDLTLKRFLLPFIFMLSIIYFFSSVTLGNFSGIIVRGLIVSWIAFVLSRRLDFNKLIELLKRKNLTHIAEAMESALKIVQKFRKKH